MNGNDPVIDRIRELAAELKRKQIESDENRRHWEQNLKYFGELIGGMVEAFGAGVTTDTPALPEIYVRFPLRRESRELGAELRLAANDDGEIVASVVPFEPQGKRSEREFRRLGPSNRLTAESVSQIIHDFLKWASVEEGRGSKKVRFD